MSEPIVFLSEYSKENLAIAEELCRENENSICGFYETKELSESKNDFNSIFDSFSDDLSEKAFILNTNPSKKNFPVEIAAFIFDSGLKNFIFKGGLEDSWILPVVKKTNKEWTMNTYLILEKANWSKNLQVHEKMILEEYDFILGMGPSCKNEKRDIKCLFENIDAGQYKVDYLVMEKNMPLILANKQHIGKIYNHVKELGLECPTIIDPMIHNYNECFLAIFICDLIFDITGNKEVELLLKKSGKKSYNSLDDVKGILENKKENTHTTLKDKKETMKDFLELLKKEIDEAIIVNVKEKEKVVLGKEI